jgi:hypothetical protein
MNKKAVLILAVVLGFIVGINILTRIYVGEIKEDVGAVPKVLKAVPQEGAADTQELTGRQPDDPAQFGIVVVSQMDQPRDQKQSDDFIQKLFDDSKLLDTDEGKEAVKAMQMNPTQYQETMTRLDGEIQKIEAAAGQNPTDPLLQRRRQVLYHLKAISRVLDKNGVVNPDAADLQRFDYKGITGKPGPGSDGKLGSQ